MYIQPLLLNMVQIHPHRRRSLRQDVVLVPAVASVASRRHCDLWRKAFDHRGVFFGSCFLSLSSLISSLGNMCIFSFLFFSFRAHQADMQTLAANLREELATKSTQHTDELRAVKEVHENLLRAAENRVSQYLQYCCSFNLSICIYCPLPDGDVSMLMGLNSIHG